MNFEQRVESIVDRKYGELLDLFHETEDRTGDLLPYLSKLVSTIPLIEDIKTEVASIEKKLQNRKPEEEDQDKEKRDKPRDRYQPTIEDQRDVQDLLDYIGDLLPDGQEQLLLPGPFGAGNGSDWFDKDITRLLFRAFSALKKLNDKINQKTLDAMSTKKIDNMMALMTNIMHSFDLLDDQIAMEIEKANQKLSKQIDALSSKMQECCGLQSQGIQDIKDKLDKLVNSKLPNLHPELQIMKQGKLLFNEIHLLRGYL